MRPRVEKADYVLERPFQVAYTTAAEFHPAWRRLSLGARRLMARNVHQVLGADLRAPARFLLCWTPHAAGRGGTGQAIRIARAYGVPVFDLADGEARWRVERMVESVRALA